MKRTRLALVGSDKAHPKLGKHEDAKPYSKPPCIVDDPMIALGKANDLAITVCKNQATTGPPLFAKTRNDTFGMVLREPAGATLN
ncbi:MAG: hypothetical protein ACFCD0_08170 [Gemmataceae bacterium]